ncbi:MAG: nitroreductase family deazaflavin-dependent oxidoreductase [Chloroflexi bacterium]|nr:nitroreductase family deazaflavin-dependent oxidoreductase [Chloroflexota bacterium]
MSLSSATIDRSRELAMQMLRAPLCLYKLGWGPALNWLPLLVLTTRGRKSGLARHVVVEYRRHGSKYYIVSGWGAETDWYRNIEKDSRVTIQHGAQIVDAWAQPVDDPAEALRALYMFSRNSWIYEALFARMSSARAGDLNTLAEVVEEFTVLRLEPTDAAPELPSVELYSPPARQMASILGLLLALRLLIWLLRR